MHSLKDPLNWWGNRPRWMYHLRTMSAYTLIGVVLFFCKQNPAIVMLGPWVTHVAKHFFSKKKYDRFNIRDTLFDSNLSGLVVAPAYTLVVMGFAYASGLLGLMIVAYIVMFQMEWNSP